MFSIAALVPSPPILVPELCGAAGRAVAGRPVDAPTALRAAVLAAVGELAAVASTWTVVGVGHAADGFYGSGTVGTFRGFGVDVRVGLSDDAVREPDPGLPLPLLIGGWLRGRVAAEAVAVGHLIDDDNTAEECAGRGARLRAELDAVAEPQGVLVVADGAATLSTAAPGYLDSRAAAVQEQLDAALAAGDVARLLALDPALCAELGMSGRAAFQVLAGLFAGDATAPKVETLYQDAPFGVGYQVSVWRPGGSTAATQSGGPR